MHGIDIAGRLMLDNLRKIDNHSAISMDYEVKIPSKRCFRLNLKGSGLAEKQEIVFLFFDTKASKLSRERRLGFTEKYMEIKTLICDFLRETSFLK